MTTEHKRVSSRIPFAAAAKPAVLAGFAGLFLGLLLLAGCRSSGSKVKVESATFQHSDEIRLGTGKAQGYCALLDRRVFAVSAFLNAAGCDEEAPGYQMHPLRLKVRKLVAENLAAHPQKLAAYKQYYGARRLGSWQYANFALSLCADYPFRRIRPDAELAYAWTPRMLIDLPEVLNDFWRTARLEAVWQACQPDYRAELERYSVERMANDMEALWRYLRMRRPDRFVIVQVPNPLQRHAMASGNAFGQHFYSVDGPSSSDGGLNIHEYLHTFVNALVQANSETNRAKLEKYFDAGKHAAISAPYNELVNWSAECLVHALDYRLAAHRLNNPAITQNIDRKVAALTRGGYSLLEPLYTSLAGFEQSQLPFDQYLPILLEQLPNYAP